MSGVTLGETEDDILAAVVTFDHWPLEVSLSPLALKHVGYALAHYLGVQQSTLPVSVPESAHQELWNTCNIIRAHLQHVVADARAAAAKRKSLEDLL